MRNNKNVAFIYLMFLIVAFLLHNAGKISAQTSNSSVHFYDVVVYGATPSGIASAVNAAREGATVLLIDESIFVGGLFSGGLPKSDFRSYESV